MLVCCRINLNLNFRYTGRRQENHVIFAHNQIRIIDLMTMTAGLSYDTGAAELMAIKEKSNNQAGQEKLLQRWQRCL